MINLCENANEHTYTITYPYVLVDRHPMKNYSN